MKTEKSMSQEEVKDKKKKVIKEKVVVRNKTLKKIQKNNGKSKEKQQLGGRGSKRTQSKSLKSKGYSKSKISGRLHQNSDFGARKYGKTCNRGPTWSCGVNDT